jgi:hypothetical protein
MWTIDGALQVVGTIVSLTLISAIVWVRARSVRFSESFFVDFTQTEW